ncbi:MarR family winged helix-turn-helix transcriptional regulator [Dyella psychrodurans]|uniref:MarR family transcriptional regulator n=1 Tax=Dyella psychrodurans TaxID=1927960 RepID=A0A370XE26_9GAMM|nr:MarR family transcriptional regulator [Dyella psychrodurans]RDS86683.1 MarR family transcriptional regulator [Dyella psychrodurans]
MAKNLKHLIGVTVMIPSRAACHVSDLSQSLAHLTGRANMAIWSFITQHTYALGGITGMQASVLLLVRDRSDVTSIDLARQYKVQPSSITGLVDRLVQRGLVVRVPSDHDRRVAYLRATDDGAALADQLGPLFDTTMESLTDGIRDADLAIFQNCLKHIALNARAAEEAASLHAEGMADKVPLAACK